MKRYFRYLAWSFLLLAGMTAVLAIVSMWVAFEFNEILIACGTIACFNYFESGEPRYYIIELLQNPWSSRLGVAFRGPFFLRLRGDGSLSYAELPLWIPIATFLLVAALFWRLARRRPPPGHCRCGYNLTGNTSGRCPECGTALVPSIRLLDALP